MVTAAGPKHAFSGRVLLSDFACEVWSGSNIFGGNYSILKFALDAIPKKVPKLAKSLWGNGLMKKKSKFQNLVFSSFYTMKWCFRMILAVLEQKWNFHTFH